jgi:hypothetical protein
MRSSFARELHCSDLRQAFPQPFELALSHGPFLGDAVLAFGEDIKLVILGQQLDGDRLASLLPRLQRERLLQP